MTGAKPRPTRWFAAAILSGLLLLAASLPIEELPAGDVEAARYLSPGAAVTAVPLVDGRWRLASKVRPLGSGGLEILRLGRTEVLPASLLDPAREPSHRRYWLGTDRLGRDLLPRLACAWRRTLATAGWAALLAVALGGLIGGLAGWIGGRFEVLLMRAVDLWAAVPKLFVLLGIAATITPSPALIVMMLTVVSWTPAARILRAGVRELRARCFVEGAIASGVGPARLAGRHLAPHLLPVAASVAALLVGELVLLESALSFLGAGFPPSSPGLGTLLQHAAEDPTGPWWPILLPGIAVVGCSWAAFRLAGRSARTDC